RGAPQTTPIPGDDASGRCSGRSRSGESRRQAGHLRRSHRGDGARPRRHHPDERSLPLPRTRREVSPAAGAVSGRRPRLILVLSENWTLVSPRDLRALVRIARDAEDAGVDGVMVSEHVVLGPSAGSEGRPANPREYALPGNQDPATPWPSSIVLLAAITAATSRIRPIAAAVIAPLRHPLLLAKDLATLDLLSEGRLVVQPTVSWHRD